MSHGDNESVSRMARSASASLEPFFNNTPATGKAAYKGPAAAEPRKNASKTPIIPELSPMYLIIVSLFTHTSSSPSKMKIGGKTDNISSKLEPVS